jgi:tetratricopeptide (TPR) repeat protein
VAKFAGVSEQGVFNIKNGEEAQLQVRSEINRLFSVLEIKNAEAKEIPPSLKPYFQTNAEAIAFGQKYQIDVVIWGDILSAEKRINYTVTSVKPQVDPAAELHKNKTMMVGPMSFYGSKAKQDGIRFPPLTDTPTALVAFMIAWTYYDNHQYQQTEEYLKKVLEIFPQHKEFSADIYYDLGFVYTEQGKDDEALSAFKEALKINPNYPEVLCIRGNIYQKQKQSFSH